MKRFPSWFSPIAPPREPEKPKDSMERHVTVQEVFLNTWDTVDFVPSEEATKISVECYEDAVSIKFLKKEEIKNPNFKKQMKKYEKDFTVYTAKLDEWKVLKEEFDLREKEKRKKLFEELKNEFDV